MGPGATLPLWVVALSWEVARTSFQSIAMSGGLSVIAVTVGGGLADLISFCAWAVGNKPGLKAAHKIQVFICMAPSLDQPPPYSARRPPYSVPRPRGTTEGL